MLITDPTQLRAVGPSESLAKAKEDTRAMQEGKGMILYKQDELENQELSAGRRMYWREFLRLLERANPQLLIKDGSAGNIAVYRPRRSSDSGERDWAKPDWYNDHAYVTGFPKDWLPEFSAITTDARGVAKREIRGWRTVLINLIQARSITYNDAKRYFGEPTGERGWRWHSQLQNYKG